MDWQAIINGVLLYISYEIGRYAERRVNRKVKRNKSYVWNCSMHRCTMFVASSNFIAVRDIANDHIINNHRFEKYELIRPLGQQIKEI